MGDEMVFKSSRSSLFARDKELERHVHVELTKEQKKHLYEEFGLWEKGYTLGVCNFVLTVIIALRHPEYYWMWHLAKAFIFLPWRFYRFKQRGWEWYMADFCYFSTYYAFIGCALAFIRTHFGIESALHQYNDNLIRTGFAFANGALALAIPLFHNKLVFHDIDNTTSMYIHISPAIFYWTIRWGAGFGPGYIEDAWPTMFDVCPDMYAADKAFGSLASMLWHTQDCSASAWDFVVWPIAVWLVGWGLPFYFVVLRALGGYLERNGKATLYADMVSDPQVKGKYIMKLPECVRREAYMLQHLLFTTVAGCLSFILWNSYILHTVYLSCILLYGIHNGSEYIFRVVAAKHVHLLIEKEHGVAYDGLQPAQ